MYHKNIVCPLMNFFVVLSLSFLSPSVVTALIFLQSLILRYEPSLTSCFDLSSARFGKSRADNVYTPSQNTQIK